MWVWPLSWWLTVAFPWLLLAFLLLSTHAQVFDEKVANVSLAFELMMDGVLHYQSSCRPFLLISAHAQVFDKKLANVSLAFELMMDGVLHDQSFCWPFYSTPHMRRFLTRRWPMWAWPLSWWWMECCITKAFVDLFTPLRTCAGFWREGGQCEPGLWADDGWSVALPRLLPTFLLLTAHAQVFEKKVATVSLAFELMIDGVLHFQGSCRPFLLRYSSRMRRFLKRRWRMWAWPLSWWWTEACHSPRRGQRTSSTWIWSPPSGWK